MLARGCDLYFGKNTRLVVEFLELSMEQLYFIIIASEGVVVAGLHTMIAYTRLNLRVIRAHTRRDDKPDIACFCASRRNLPR